jgi:hypothetical protein
MIDDAFSFVFDREGARAALPRVGTEGLVVAALARIPPADGWEGCIVYTGETPLDPAATACVGTRGPGADEVQVSLVEQFEALQIPVLAVYEGGPEQLKEIARAEEGRWCAER